MLKPMCLKRSEEIAAKFGFKPAPHDHPIYSEGPTIIFVSKSPKTFVNKANPSVDVGTCKNTQSADVKSIE